MLVHILQLEYKGEGLLSAYGVVRAYARQMQLFAVPGGSRAKATR